MFITACKDVFGLMLFHAEPREQMKIFNPLKYRLEIRMLEVQMLMIFVTTMMHLLDHDDDDDDVKCSSRLARMCLD